MVNFKPSEEMRNDLINTSRAQDKKKSESLTGIEPMYDLLYNDRMLYPLSYEGLVASWAIYKVHV